MTLPPVFTPKSLAERWQCSERHIRNLIDKGELAAFRLGGKLLRLRGADVLEFEAKTDVLDIPDDAQPVQPKDRAVLPKKQRAARLDQPCRGEGRE